MSLLTGVLRGFDLDLLMYTFYELYRCGICVDGFTPFIRYYCADAYSASDPELASLSWAA